MATTDVPAAWRGLVDDAAIFPPGDSPLDDAVAAFAARRDEWYADLVGSFVVKDVDVPNVDARLPLSIVVTGGAGAIGGALKLAAKSPCSVAGLEIALRDLDDLAGNARRVVAAVDAARSEGLLEDESSGVRRAPPRRLDRELVGGCRRSGRRRAAAEVPHRWAGGRGSSRTRTPSPAGSTRRWTGRRRSSARPGLHNALRHTGDDGFEHHGFLNVLLATRLAFDGASTDDVVAVLEQRDAEPLLALWHDQGEQAMARTRRWFTSFGSCSVTEPRDDLISLGLVEAPA